MPERVVMVDLGDGLRMAALAEVQGPDLVAAGDVLATLEAVTAAIERTGQAALDAVKRVAPDKATVELAFGLALEEGQLIALFARGKAQATITVTLEWSGDASGGDAGG